MLKLLTRLHPHAIGAVALGVIALVDASRLSGAMARKINIDAVGPHGYLMFLGVALLGLGLVMLYQHARAEPDAELPDIPWRDLVIVVGLLSAYALIIGIVGFTLATAAFLLLISRRLSGRSWLWCTAFSIVTAAAFYLAFVYLSDMALPRGGLWD